MDTRLIVALLLGILAFVSVLSPAYLIQKNDNYDNNNGLQLVGIGNMLASGILLAAGLTHALADAQDSLKNEESTYPFAEFICGLTFVLFIIFEEAMHLTLYSDSASCDLEANKCETTSLINGNCNGVENRYHSTATILPSSSQQLHHHVDHLSLHLRGSWYASFALMFALCVHSFIEGLAVGFASSSNVSSMWSISIAIIAHKGFAGYALGSSLASSDVNWACLVIMGLIFALCSPLGIVSGILFLESAGTHQVLFGVTQAVVSGTFLYVSIVEICMKEIMSCRHPRGSRYNRKLEVLKLMSFLVGFGAMSWVAAYA